MHTTDTPIILITFANRSSNILKSLIPIWLKRVAWYLFKSPQRSIGLASSWMIEIIGFCTIQFYTYIYKNKKLKPVSICTGLKNRSNHYLTITLASILKMRHQELIELSVYDCGSTDVSDLVSEIRKHWQGTLIYHSEELSFERSKIFNRAIAQCTNELFFVSDADMELPENLVALCNTYVHPKIVWFPICFHLFQNKKNIMSPENGSWRYSGMGMFASLKNSFYTVGAYDEKFKTWGEEDIDLWTRYYKNGIYPYRKKCKGLFHHYHETAEGAKEFIPNKNFD